MKEIVTIQIGNCGNRIGSAFWEELSSEHGILSDGFWCGESELQLQGIHSFFVDGATGRNYVPRCVLIDLDPDTLDSVRCSPPGQLYRPDNFIFGRAGSGNNYGRGHFAGGREILDMAMEVTRKEVERCDWPVGFQMLGALGGGTGSGFTTLVLESLKEEYPKLINTNHLILPGGGYCSDAVVEPYNAVLSCPDIVKHSDITICMDNQCLYDICHRTLTLDQPSYVDMNEIIARVMVGLTATYRFPSSCHVSWKAMKCLMIPTPKLHFFVPGYAPLNSRGVQGYRDFSTFDITYQMLNAKDCLLGPGVIPKSRSSLSSSSLTSLGKYITGLTVYRGYTVNDQEITKYLYNFQERNMAHLVPWMPYHFLKAICEMPAKGPKISSTFLLNHSGAVRAMWGNILRKFKNMFRRKAFLHWFYGEGCHEEDFKQAEEQVHCLIEEYKYCESQPPKQWEPMDEDKLLKKCLDDEIPIPIVQWIKFKRGKFPFCEYNDLFT